jgi:hypothetical protein
VIAVARRLGLRIQSVFASWVALWDRREPPTALALIRILVALVLLSDFLIVLQLGLVEALWSPPPDGFVNGRRLPWFVEQIGAGPGTAWFLWGAEVAALFGMLTGTFTRVSCVLFVLVSAQMAELSPDGDRGIDTILRLVVTILAFSQSNARWSVDAWIRRRIGRPFAATVPAWPRLLLFLQAIWVYFSSGHNKAPYEWGFAGNFTALGNTLSDPHFARWNPSWFEPVYPITQVGTATTMLFELSAPLMLLFAYYAATADRPGRLRHWCNRLRLRWLWFGLGVVFHIGIAAAMQLGIFAWGMLALYPSIVLPEDLVRAEAWIRSIPQRRAARRAARSADRATQPPPTTRSPS